MVHRHFPGFLSALNAQGDVRTVDKLVDGVVDGSPAHSWLTAVRPGGRGAVLSTRFEAPIMLSMLRFWNYERTPQRGAREIEIHLDDMLIFKVQILFLVQCWSHRLVVLGLGAAIGL